MPMKSGNMVEMHCALECAGAFARVNVLSICSYIRIHRICDSSKAIMD